MKKKLFILFLFLPLLLSAQLKINELMSNNVSAVMDKSYNYSMWVELYNTGTTTIYLASYYITDNLDNPSQFKLPNTYIAASGYNAFWFERHDISAHAPFKLEPSGGKLYLLDNTFQVVDSVFYPKQYRNTSYGRIPDGADQWTYFYDFSWRNSNNNKKQALNTQTPKPQFEQAGGFYTGTQQIKFVTPTAGDTIYYTTNGDEPTINSTRYIYGNAITLTKTTCLRARAFSGSKIPSNIASATYFINERNFTLPVVSIITENKNLNDNTIGIYVVGTNGITGNGMDYPCNWNQDWDRPANVEIYDTTGVARVNQEMDISIAGGWSRAWLPRSLNLSPRKKFGSNKLGYDVFAATKPNREYKDIRIRNSGNDYNGCLMRDAFMQSLIMGRTDIDYLAYEPAICFINGTYYGIQNLRERSNKDYLYTNYGLSDDEFEMYENTAIYTSPFVSLMNFVRNNNLANDAIYAQVCDSIDINSFIDYMLAQIYFDNTDWPHNNIRIWRRNSDKKWRCILYDTDFGFTSAGSNSLNNVLNSTDKFNNYSDTHISVVFRNLVKNEMFLNAFIDRFSIHISSTFEENRVNQVMDSLSAKIVNEVAYHKAKWGGSNFNNVLSGMKTFGAQRPNNMLNFIANRYLSGAAIRTIDISSNINHATYTFNDQKLIDNKILLKSFNGRNVELKAEPVKGYKFQHWLLHSSNANTYTVFPKGTAWTYFDQGSLPAQDWNTLTYADVTWNTGNAPLGYGNTFASTLQTTVSYGSNASSKYTTTYFRKKVNITDLEQKTNFQIALLVDDGAVVYVNGTEIGRYNMPTGAITYNTFATTYNNGDEVTFVVPQSVLINGENIITAEVHQCDFTSSDLVFDLALTYQKVDEAGAIHTEPTYSTTLNTDIKIQAIYTQSEEEFNADIPAIFINEIVSGNTVITDEFNEKEDYIELYNASDEAIDVGGWYLTDNPNLPMLCQIPTHKPSETTIAPNGFLILWADKQTEQGTLHLNLKLAKEGETLMLSYKNQGGQLQLVDSVSFPNMANNLAYARVPDGTSNWVVQNTTFNSSNMILTSTPVEVKNQLMLYPTLVTDHLVVKNVAQKSLLIYDIFGKCILQKDLLLGTNIINTNGLKPGIYIVNTDEKNFKIIKL